MPENQIFISYSLRDDTFVRELREALEAQGIPVWVDSRGLRGGGEVAPEVERVIARARAFVAVLSLHTINSPWVRREIRKAVEVDERRHREGYRIIPVLLPGIEPSALPLWFDEEPAAVFARAGTVAEALTGILSALGERMPGELLAQEIAPKPVEELLLVLTDPRAHSADGKRRLSATAQLAYTPADRAARRVESRRFHFNSPLGAAEAEELRWYLESYHLWPAGLFKERALSIEAMLPKWGRDLYQASLASQSTEAVLGAWARRGEEEAERRFSVLVDASLPEGHSWREQLAAQEAAADLLSLPWELLHDGTRYLFQGKEPASIRRRLPSRRPQRVVSTTLPIRILLVSPRPEDEHSPYVDHRVTALPLAEAVESLGELAELTVLTPPTFPALEAALRQAATEGRPFAVVHFDGHGIFDHERGFGSLCFEDPRDAQQLTGRRTELVKAEALSTVARDQRIPLVFLDASETAATAASPTASVAAKLLEEGVTSVVAMSYNVRVEAARLFVGSFYQTLAAGRRVGPSVLAGRQALYGDTTRGRILDAGELHLQDWFVPVLYQEEQDPQLIKKLPPQAIRGRQEQQRLLSLGEVPPRPAHGFHGRSRELLTLERLLQDERYAVVRGQGGAGKTTFAAELAVWLVKTNRFQRAAFVSVEEYADLYWLLSTLGRQLMPENWEESPPQNRQLALQLVRRALADRPTIIILDNMENLLPSTQEAGHESKTARELFSLCQDILSASAQTRLVFTTRESLPAPFDASRNELSLGPLAREDAITLVSQVMAQVKEGDADADADPGDTPAEVTALVEAVGCHARALMLLAREVARQGVRATTENLRQLIEGLHKDSPSDDREESLFASLELSMRRLSPESSGRLKALAPFHGGANLAVLAQVLEAKPEEVKALAEELVGVGVAEYVGDGHLRLDPALPSYVARGMDEATLETIQTRWAEAMVGLTEYLSQQQYGDAGLGARLTMLELPNLLALLRLAEKEAAPEYVVLLATNIARLLSNLGQQTAADEAGRVRDRAAQKLGGWSHALFVAESAGVDSLLERGEVRAAYDAAERLLGHCSAAGESAYPGAAYDLGMAYFKLGRVLKTAGSVERALPQLEEARRRFAELSKEDAAAQRMLTSLLTEVGDCLRSLGRLDEAATVYEQALAGNSEFGDRRAEAVNKAQLATVRLHQKRFDEALVAFEEARRTFEILNEPVSVGITWHQIGTAHMELGRYELAERAYRQSLAIYVQQKYMAGEAGSLTQLGNLYTRMARHEESVKCYRQAADIAFRLRDLNTEGRIRNNLAIALIQLGQYDEARTALQRAAECKEPYGVAAEPWTTWALMQTLEQMSDNRGAADAAWHKAVESYYAYRRDGGEALTPSGQICAMVLHSIKDGDTSQVEQSLATIPERQSESNPWLKLLTVKLRAILQGSRDTALADDTALDYEDAVELKLLLESLSASS